MRAFSISYLLTCVSSLASAAYIIRPGVPHRISNTTTRGIGMGMIAYPHEMSTEEANAHSGRPVYLANSAPQAQSDGNSDNKTKVLEPRRDFPDWSVRPGGTAPCPGWPGRRYFNETHWVEWRFRCFCKVYGKYDPSCKIPEHYGWGNGQNDAVQGQVKCLKKTWWGCAKTEKPKNIADA